MIAHWPKGFAQQGTRHAACHVVDILPTILEVTGVCAIVELGETEVQAVQGESLLTLLKGADWQREQPIFFEHEGNSALRMGRFKLVRQYGMKWELYDMELDRTELRNLAAGARDQVRDMAYL
ncbi:sulfatase/phosphatase domain-containing protein [Planktotalea arctica]|uniref:sulfatase/phosphatase domain-containing protein n=1 Tax=Planktotalea arctica TaxID=1481893 RepID=UPI003218FD94